MKIVVITGTSRPFARLVDRLASHAQQHPDDAVWIQHGGAGLPVGVEGQESLPREALLERVREADVVVCHAGSGTLRDVLSSGHVPVVLPRLASRGEHVNDHQLELFEELVEQGRALALPPEGLLTPVLERARGLRRTSGVELGTRARLLEALAADVRTLLATRPH